MMFKRFEAMKLLLQSGATHRALSESDDTILHLVAKLPEAKIIEYLPGYKLGYVEDLASRDRDGLTAHELLHKNNLDPLTALAFQHLVMRVVNSLNANGERISELEVQDVSDSDPATEVFEDAVEEQRMNKNMVAIALNGNHSSDAYKW